MDHEHTDRLKYRWSEYPTGWMYLILTQQQGPHVHYECVLCKHLKCFAQFLRVADNGHDFTNELTLACLKCVPSKPWRPDFNGKRLGKCRIHVILPQGQVLGFFDTRDKKLLRTEEFGIRRMKPDGNEFRLQPYLDRSNHEIRKPNPTGRLFRA